MTTVLTWAPDLPLRTQLLRAALLVPPVDAVFIHIAYKHGRQARDDRLSLPAVEVAGAVPLGAPGLVGAVRAFGKVVALPIGGDVSPAVGACEAGLGRCAGESKGAEEAKGKEKLLHC